MTQHQEIAIQNLNYFVTNLVPLSLLTHPVTSLHIHQKKGKISIPTAKCFMTPTILTLKIQNALPGALVEVSSHDNVHFQATVTYHGFAGKTKVAQHRMVYAPLQDDFQEALHALQLTTLIPTESS